MIARSAVRRAGLALTTFVLSLVLLGGFGTASMTDATWNDRQPAEGTFETSQIGRVNNLQCEDEGGLLTGRIRLRWEEPKHLENENVEYMVSWQGNGLIGGGGSTTTSDLQYEYTPSLLNSVLQFSIDYTVTPSLPDYSWEGDPDETSASGLVGLLGIVVDFNCDG